MLDRRELAKTVKRMYGCEPDRFVSPSDFRRELEASDPTFSIGDRAILVAVLPGWGASYEGSEEHFVTASTPRAACEIMAQQLGLRGRFDRFLSYKTAVIAEEDGGYSVLRYGVRFVFPND